MKPRPPNENEPGRRVRQVRDRLRRTYGPQRCFLDHATPVQLLVAAQLSAQCTDERVNRLTPALFARFPDAAAVANAPPSELERMIRGAGLFRNKARNLIAACQRVRDDFHGEIPADMAALVSLPGVGRKTANVILGHAFGIPGFPVDTHVLRVMNRLGLVATRNPEQIEDWVNRHLPARFWTEFSLLLIRHGRARCQARTPDCPGCELRNDCARVGLPPMFSQAVDDGRARR
jgi:endonuclease-3